MFANEQYRKDLPDVKIALLLAADAQQPRERAFSLEESRLERLPPPHLKDSPAGVQHGWTLEDGYKTWGLARINRSLELFPHIVKPGD